MGTKTDFSYFVSGYVKDAPQKASCNHCTKSLQPSELAVYAPKLRENVSFFPKKCETFILISFNEN